MEMTIKDLVEAARQGDQQAMTQLYERTNRRAYYLAVELVKDEDQAWDILQDSYVKAFKSLNDLADPAKFQSWLNMIVTNKSKDYLRKKRPMLFSQLASEDDEDANIDFEDESGQFSPEAAVDYSETKRLVQEMIDDLSDDQRMAIVLHYMEYYSVKQIAEIMGCSEGTVKSRLNYGRKAIKDRVLLLERQGTKLYCLPLAPFLYWLFRQQAQSVLFPWEAAAAGAASGAAGAAETGSVGAGAGASAGTVGVSAVQAAGKAGITILGKTIGNKGAAIAAFVCVAAGAGIGGGVYAARHFVSPSSETIVAEIQETDGGEAQEVSQETGYTLTDEERQVLQKIYQVAENRDYEALTAAFLPEFARLYRMEREYFPNQYIIFDGENLSTELEGYKLAICTSSLTRTGGKNKGKVSYWVKGYLGNFTDGQPEGEILSFRNSYIDDKPARDIDITLADYSQGKTVGTSETESWHLNDDGSAACNFITTGAFDENGDPTGEFFMEDYSGVQVVENGRVDKLFGLSFHVQIDTGDPEVFLNLPDSEKVNRFNLEADDGYILDDSGQHQCSIGQFLNGVEAHVLWDERGSWHGEGTEDLLPDGNTLTAG